MLSMAYLANFRPSLKNSGPSRKKNFPFSHSFSSLSVTAFKLELLQNKFVTSLCAVPNPLPPILEGRANQAATKSVI